MTTAANTRMGQLVAELGELEERLRQGGGPAKIEKQHSQGKLTARERVELLLDPGGGFLEIGTSELRNADPAVLGRPAPLRAGFLVGAKWPDAAGLIDVKDAPPLPANVLLT